MPTEKSAQPPPIIDTLGQLTIHLSHPSVPRAWPAMKRVLMVTPEQFRIDYAINPHMTTETGALQTVDRDLAQKQWHELKAAYERIGFPVETLSADPALPDMVFAANQSFPFWSSGEKPAVVLSKMQSPHRQPEVPHFRRWFETKGYEIRELSSADATFEGNGDAIAHPGRGFLWGAVGPRTTREAYDELAALTGLTVIRLPLQVAELYHLDTCFTLLRDDTVAVQKKAFGVAELRMIHEVFDHVIDVDHYEAVHLFAGNGHCPDGRHVLLQRGARKLARDLEKKQFDVVEVETGEFMKSGGSVFCLKMMVF